MLCVLDAIDQMCHLQILFSVYFSFFTRPILLALFQVYATPSGVFPSTTLSTPNRPTNSIPSGPRIVTNCPYAVAVSIALFNDKQVARGNPSFVITLYTMLSSNPYHLLLVYFHHRRILLRGIFYLLLSILLASHVAHLYIYQDTSILHK